MLITHNLASVRRRLLGLSVPTHVLLLDVIALKNPVVHALHWGSEVIVPLALVYLPGGHLV